MRKDQEIASVVSCLNRAADDEPLFVLRANDENAPAIVMAWAEDYLRSKGGWVNMMTPQLNKYNEAVQLASDMRIWKMRNNHK